MLEPMTFADFEAAQRLHPSYYRASRWAYYQQAIEYVQNIAPESILEIGPHLQPIFRGSDTLAIRGPDLTYQLDAGETPWPIDRKAYDVIVALQVWEHLEGRQREAFAEVARVAHHAVMSFPIGWNCPSDPTHHAITREMIRDWTLGIEPIDEIQVGKRIVIRWDF